jgi:hypothetical protein
MAGRKRKVIEDAPGWLFDYPALDALAEEVSEKDRLLRSLKPEDYGPRVTDPDEARRLMEKVMRITAEAAGMAVPENLPELDLTRKLRVLPYLCFRQFLFLSGVGLILFIAGLSIEFPARYFPGLGAVWAAVLACPYLICRRSRLEIERESLYVRTAGGRGRVTVDELPAALFQTYLVHELAHHLYHERFGETGQPWQRHGWARLVQWRATTILAEENPACLYHVLLQIVSELKYAAESVTVSLGLPVPPKAVRNARTMYVRNPLYRIATGTPGFNPLVLFEISLGTAAFFVLEKKLGYEKAVELGPDAIRGYLS